MLLWRQRIHPRSYHGLSYNLSKSRYECLRQPEAEYQLRPRHEQFRRETLEETRETLLPGHIRQDSETALRVLKVAVLYPRLDDV